MKDLVREYGRIAAFFAAAAFVLSLLVGLLSGNPFGTALLRAFLLGVFFAALGIGFSFVIKRYLPELLNPSASRAAAEDKDRGHAVDIVLPDENPHEAGVMEAESAEGAEEVLEEAEAAEPEGRGSFPEPMEGQGVGEAGAETHASGTAPAVDTGEVEALSAAHAAKAQEEIYDEEPAEVISEDAGGMEPAPEPEISAQGSPGLDNLDTLPDIGDLDNISGVGTTISQDMRGAAPRPAPRPRSSRPMDELGGAVSEQDPESLAKAIRTVLRRDEKG